MAQMLSPLILHPGTGLFRVHQDTAVPISSNTQLVLLLPLLPSNTWFSTNEDISNDQHWMSDEFTLSAKYIWMLVGVCRQHLQSNSYALFLAPGKPPAKWTLVGYTKLYPIGKLQGRNVWGQQAR